MELREVMENRRSIRAYKDTDIANEVVEDLIYHARLAPSAKNRQPWEFVIVKDEAKERITEIMLENLKEDENNIAYSSVRETAAVMKEAPVVILVFTEIDMDWLISDVLSVGAAIEHICLRATDLGLGSLWICDTVYTQEQIAKFVGKEGKRMISAVAVGHGLQNPPQRPRKSVEEILTWF